MSRSLSTSILMVVVGAAAVGLLWAAGAMRPREVAELPVLATVPDFSLVDASGADVRLADLQGHPWVADLIFTTCAGICPRMTREMATLAGSSGDPTLHFVSFSVDPETDTPEVLREYAERMGADHERWRFLTGEAETIRRIAEVGFLLPVHDGDESQGDERILHSSRFVLVDEGGRVRGTYDTRDPEAMLRLRGDLTRLSASG